MFWLPLILVVVFLAGGGFLWGHQVIADNMARSAYKGIDKKIARDLRAARSAGMFPSEFRPYSSASSRIETKRAPGDATFWSGNQASFYDRQTNKLKALDARLDAQLRHLTLAAKARAMTLVGNFAAKLRRAKADGLTVPGFLKAYRTARLNLSESSRLGLYRALAGQVQPKISAIQGVISGRERDLAYLNKQVRHSSHYRAQAYAEVSQRFAVAQRNLTVLDMFHKAPRLKVWLDHTAAWARSRHKIRKIMIGAADLGTVSAAIGREVDKYAPAKWIYVSTENETISWYEHGKQIGSSLCTTGNPTLPTVTGHFTIFAKFSPFTFVSPEPKDSPDYYLPSPVSFAMEFQAAGYFIHDAPWRSAFGPGTDGYGQPGTNYGGTHGCVNVPYDVAAFLFGWAPDGTTVVVV